MHALKILAGIVIVLYVVVIVALYALQSRLIFFPGKLPPDFKFTAKDDWQELFLPTRDGERINALFFPNRGNSVILYFHGNAGDLSGWQFLGQDFLSAGYNFMIIDYRGYGKSSGKISENGLYLDADAAYDYLIQKGFAPEDILIYGRSIGSGVAVDLASRKTCQGLILEAPYSSMGKLATEKFPFFFPSLYLQYKFDNLGKINHIRSPVIFLHGLQDNLVPPSHSRRLFEIFNGKKKLIEVPGGSHNDLASFTAYVELLKSFPAFFQTP